MPLSNNEHLYPTFLSAHVICLMLCTNPIFTTMHRSAWWCPNAWDCVDILLRCFPLKYWMCVATKTYPRGSQPAVHIPLGIHLLIRKSTFKVSNGRGNIFIPSKSSIKNSVDFCYFTQPFYHKNYRGACSSVEKLKGTWSEKGWELLTYPIMHCAQVFYTWVPVMWAMCVNQALSVHFPASF